MTKNEARRCARRCLCNYHEDLARLEQKKFKKASLSSLKSVDFANDAGKSSARYVDSVPWWLEAEEELERSIGELILRTRPITVLLEMLDRTEGFLDLRRIYTLRWEQRLGWTAAMMKMQEFGITEKMFRRLEARLVDLAALYLDLAVPEEPKGSKRVRKGSEKGEKNMKSAVNL